MATQNSINSGSGTTGQVLTAVTNGAPLFQDVSVTGAFMWVSTASATFTASANTGYVMSETGLATVTLPLSTAVGTMVGVARYNLSDGHYLYLANGTSGNIHMGSITSTAGTGHGIRCASANGMRKAIATHLGSNNWFVVDVNGTWDVY
jgi:hypothetical protein